MQLVKMNHRFGCVLFLCFGWGLSHAANTKIYAEGGNANGQPCVLPFIYKSKWYLDCTGDGTSDGRLWCSTTADYNKDKKWGYCPKKLIYVNGQPCVFPFKYKSKWYWGCTGDGATEGRLWCATTSDYNKDKKWGYCPQKLLYAVGGNANRQPCVFPFKYKSKGYWGCTGDGTSDGRLWCATTADYNKDKKWGYCTSNLIYAVGGNANGQLCVFPFNYKSKWYSECTGDGTSDGRLWCATTADYNKDNKWGYCPQKMIYTVGGNANGESCVFPFKYKSKWYSYCTSDGGPDGLLWCATTAYYDSDKKWGYCPQNVIYTEGGNANGQPCVFPFTYKSKWYWNCTTDGSYSWSPWCATTTNVDKDNKWGKCLSQVIYTKGGNANGEPCVFPFKYKSRWHLDCITDGTTDGSLWCSTTLDYDKDKKSGNCIRKLTDQKTKREEKVSGTSLSMTDQKTKREEKVSGTSFPMIYAEGGNANGELCVFPFNYESKWYSDCTSDGTPNGRLWCATTADYNNDKKWGYCPQKGEKEEELYTGEEVLDPANAAEGAN